MQYTAEDKVKACQVAMKLFQQHAKRYEPHMSGNAEMTVTETVFLGSRHSQIAVGLTVKWEGGLHNHHSWRMFTEIHVEMQVLHHDGLRFLKLVGMHRVDGPCACAASYDGWEKVQVA